MGLGGEECTCSWHFPKFGCLFGCVLTVWPWSHHPRSLHTAFLLCKVCSHLPIIPFQSRANESRNASQSLSTMKGSLSRFFYLWVCVSPPFTLRFGVTSSAGLFQRPVLLFFCLTYSELTPFLMSWASRHWISPERKQILGFLVFFPFAFLLM